MEPVSIGESRLEVPNYISQNEHQPRHPKLWRKSGCFVTSNGRKSQLYCHLQCQSALSNVWHGRELNDCTEPCEKPVGSWFCKRRCNVSIYRQLSPVSSSNQTTSHLDRLLLSSRQCTCHVEHIPAFSAGHVCAIRPRFCGKCRRWFKRLAKRRHGLGLSWNDLSHCQRTNPSAANSSFGFKISKQHSWKKTPHHLCSSVMQSGSCRTVTKFSST